MFNTYTQFENMAFVISDAKAASKQVREGSLTHKLAWCAYAILASGSDADKESLSNAVAKGAAYETFKGTVSKAKTVLSYLQEGHEVNGLTLESINESLSDNIAPEAKLTTLYVVAKGEVKAESDEEKRIKAIKKQAMAMMQVAHPEVAITNKTFDAHPHKLQFLADAAPIIDSRLAASAKVKANESREALLARLVNEIVSNNLTNEVIQALSTSGKAQSDKAQAA